MTRDDVIAYLLHRQADEERAAFAERWMTDPALYEEVRRVEAELLDAYVRREVAPDERALIERYLLASPGQRDKLMFAEALNAAFATRPSGRMWSRVAAAAAILMAIASIWLFAQNRTLRRDLTTATTRPPAAQPTGAVYSVLLPLTAVRGPQQAQPLTIPPGSDILRLDLELEAGDEARIYSAVVSQSGRTVWSEEPIRAAASGRAWVLPVWIPVNAVAPGEYEIRISTSGTAIGYYAFSIAR